MNTYHNALPAHGERHPLTAAVLSIIPGLGQFYVGDKRKGILFFDVALINYILLSLVCFSGPIAKAINSFANQYKFTVNDDLVGALLTIKLGSASSFFLIGMMVLFVSFAARDAYDKAFGLRRKKIYGDSIIDLSEATSGSYIGHIAMMLSCLLLAMLFVHPPQHPKQWTEIEFQLDQKVKPAVKPPDTHVVSTKNVEHSGKRHHDTPAKIAQQSTQASVKQPSESKPETQKSAQTPKPATAVAPAPSTPVNAVQPAPAPAPTPVVKPMPVRLAMAHPAPAPAPTPAAAAPARPQPIVPIPRVEAPKLLTMVPPAPMPLPTAVPAAPTAPTALPHSRFVAPSFGNPMPIAPAQHMGAGISTMPSMSSSASSTSGTVPEGLPSKLPGTGPASTAGAPGPKAITGSNVGTTTGAPNVVPVHGPASSSTTGRGCAGCGGTAGHGPAPVKAASSPIGADGGPFAVAPTFHIGGPTSGTSKLAPDDIANPNKDGKDGPVQVDTKELKGPDFTGYMAELQRKIKRAWFPPRGTENLRAVVLFKVHEGGALSDLRIAHSSGVQGYDSMALKAVETAAPFRHLPTGAPESVDIEFTFDFNVFNNR